jgi:iron-sulfur cluster assembly protein
MGVTLTESAAQRVRDYAAKERKPGAGLRIAVKPSGCSGMAYVLELEDKANFGDKESVYECHGIPVVVDPKSLVYVDGAQLDYVCEGVQEGFKVSNPNVKDECGCGESFTV